MAYTDPVARLSDLTAAMERSKAAQDYITWTLERALAGGSEFEALTRFEARVGSKSASVERVKSAIGAVTTGGASMLLRPLSNEFLSLVSARSAFDRIAAAGQRVPPGVSVSLQSVGSSMAWVGEGLGAPAITGTFSAAALRPFKIAGITIFTKELARSNDRRAVAAITRSLTRAAVVGTDTAAFALDAAAIAGTRPDSLVYGSTEVSPTGDIEADVVNLMETVSGGNLEAPYFVTSGPVSVNLAGRRNSGGARIFPTATATGGDILGVPLLVSPGAPDALILIDASGIVVVDEGLELDVADQASVESSDGPTQDGGDGTGAEMLSLWQLNAVGILVIRYLHWAKRSDAVSFRRVSLDSSPVF